MDNDQKQIVKAIEILNAQQNPGLVLFKFGFYLSLLLMGLGFGSLLVFRVVRESRWMKKQRQMAGRSFPVVAAGFLLVNPRPVYGFFGFGDIVFDPTSYGSLAHIWSQDISNGAKLAATYNQTVKIVENGLQMYKLAYAMAQRVQNKQVWQLAAFSVGNEIAQSHYNETINFNAVMNGDVLNAGHAWHQSTRYGTDAGYLGAQHRPNSSRMAEFATIQLLDQTSQRCASILANYKQTQDANQQPKTSCKAIPLTPVTPRMHGRWSERLIRRADSGADADASQRQPAGLSGRAATLEAKVKHDQLADEQNWYAEQASERASSPALLDPVQTAAMHRRLHRALGEI